MYKRVWERERARWSNIETHTNAPFDALIKLICYATNITNGIDCKSNGEWDKVNHTVCIVDFFFSFQSQPPIWNCSHTHKIIKSSLYNNKPLHLSASVKWLMQIYISLASSFCRKWSKLTTTKKISKFCERDKGKKTICKTEIHHLKWIECCRFVCATKKAVKQTVYSFFSVSGDWKYNLEHQLWFGCQTSSFCFSFDIRTFF